MKIVSTSLSDQAYELVKGEILKGTIKAGSKISEDALATQFGVSRTPIREAIRRLAEYGLVTLSPRSHAAVVKISDKVAQDIASLRINLEFFAIDNLQENLFDKNFSKLTQLASDCQLQLSNGERDKAFELDSAFHSLLIECTDNQALIEVYYRLDPKIQLLRIEQDLSPESLLSYLQQHTKLLLLLKNNEKLKAKKLIREHITHQ
ncbi:MAG: GntR family transcriptional regulator [Spirochaetales bacterium]|uniref:GntR family transcriptional regulator n=1 Tax=Bullifex sp. TaxID=2815808 RepID=UPI002A4E5F7E|nr:GntR family transcriptional regulator [Bullifex sp.]MDD7272064.1 GntR family transcriptional regulator [Spirochaetales bacterium]MDY4068132.1 GntR family transcriptional regulator [Bullifex sp.]